MRSETERRFSRLTRWLKAVGTLTPEETAARDRLVAALTGMRVAEVVPQCHGVEDHDGTAMCDGTDVRPIVFHTAQNAAPMGVNFCADCRVTAAAHGYIIDSVGEPLPPLPTDYPCGNWVGSCKRRVSRKGEYCTTACQLERLGECSHDYDSHGRGR